MKKLLLLPLLLFFFIAGAEEEPSAKPKQVVYTWSINKQIGPSVWHMTKSAFEDAADKNADYMVIKMNTYGGAVVQADSIRTRILNSPIPVYVFINNNAASAGALISIACDKIYMRKGASIGAATVVNMTGEAMPDKYQSYMRSTMRATAEAHGKDTVVKDGKTEIKWIRDPQIAEAMVDERIEIAGLIDSTKVLTLTPLEAMDLGFCDGIVEAVSELLEKEGISNYEIMEFRPTAVQNIIGFLTNPIVQGILIMMMIGGIYFELQTPGIGFPIALSLFAAIIYFAPLYLEGLAANYEILIFIIGIILLALEVFVIPGFGVAGVAGIICVVAGLTLSMVDNWGFSTEGFPFQHLLEAIAIVVSSMFMSLLLSIYFGRKLFGSRKLAFALHTEETTAEGYIGVDASISSLVGRVGMTYSVLRPSGKVMVDGEIYDAVSSDGQYIIKGSAVKVVKTSAGQIFVTEV